MTAEHVTTARTGTALLGPTARDFARFGGRELRPYERHRVERMHERVAPVIVERARRAEIKIDYLGVSELFNETRIYRGADNDWTLAPVVDDDPAIAPQEQLRVLQRLTKANAAPFLAYVAHEIDRSKSEHLLPELQQQGRTVVSRDLAAELVGPIPEDPAITGLAAQLDGHSTKVFSAVRKGAPIAAGVLLGVLAAPFLIAGAVVGAVAGLDPIVIGAVPILRAEIGEPALFFELTRWNW
jgi:hypothetical protein